eukprot:1300895-Rhodomonas_salina.2
MAKIGKISKIGDGRKCPMCTRTLSPYKQSKGAMSPVITVIQRFSPKVDSTRLTVDLFSACSQRTCSTLLSQQCILLRFGTSVQMRRVCAGDMP